MKKYYVIELQGRGEAESAEVIEVKSVNDLVKLKKKQLVDGLKEELSEREIKDYVEEWFMSEKNCCGVDISLGEEWSFICIDMESDLYKEFKDKDGEDLITSLLEGFWDCWYR